MLRRALAVGALFGAFVLATSVAFASLPGPQTLLSGTSKHKRYTVQFSMECLKDGCKQSTTFAFSVAPLHAKGNCATKTVRAYQFAKPKLKGSAWTDKGQFDTGKGQFKVTASGTFKGKTVTGTVKAPSTCGGSDSFTAKSQAVSGY